MKNSRGKVATSSIRSSMVGNPNVRDRIWPNFELIQALMYVIGIYKYEKDPIKNSREKVATPFFPIIRL